MYSLWKIFRPIARLPYALIIAFKRHIRINKIDYDGKYKEEIKNLSKKGYTTFQHLVSSFDLEELIKIDTKLSSSISKSGHPGYVRLHNIHTDNPLPNSLLNLCQKFANEYFNIEQKSEYMLIAFDVKSKMKRHISATVHVDNTCRVQTVTKNSNIKFYNLLNKMHQKTQIPVLLNTSFNIKGQPIVNSPEDAIMCFLKYKIDYLFIGDYILQKRK